MDFQTLETNARRAHEMMSFREFKEGRASEEYKGYCARADEFADKAKERLERAGAPAERAEKVDYILNQYKQKKFEWMNNLYRNQASCPSVMVCGPANFPVRKKEKQIARDDAILKENPDYLLDKIREIGNNANTIYSDEENAVERIKEKIERLKETPDSYGNRSAEIRRLKERLLQLAPEEFAEQQASISINGAKTYAEIIALWETGERTFYDSGSGDRRFYWNLPLLFTDGKRKYKEFLQVETDENGENLLNFNLKTMETDSIPLTDDRKYSSIIWRINGSGNKAVIYQYLKGLSPAVQERRATAAEAEKNGQNVTINGESAEVKRNREAMRLQLVFDGKPDENTRGILKGNGFKWAPSAGAWQRLLNDNAESALRRITDREVSA